MAHLPGRPRNAQQVPVPASDAPSAPHRDENLPYDHDDHNTTADYATEQEYTSYDDPDSIADIIREKVESFYVGTREPKPVVSTVTVTGPQVNAGYVVASGGIAVRGWTLYAPTSGGAVSLVNSVNPQALPEVVLAADTLHASNSAPVQFEKGLSVSAFKTVPADFFMTLYVEKRV